MAHRALDTAVADMTSDLANIAADFSADRSARPATLAKAQADALLSALSRLSQEVRSLQQTAEQAYHNPGAFYAAGNAAPVNPPVATAEPPNSLASIARQFGLKVRDLRALNPHIAAFHADEPLPPETALSLRTGADPSPAAAEDPDTIRGVAAAHGVPIQDLLDVNPSLEEFDLDSPLPPRLALRVPRGLSPSPPRHLSPTAPDHAVRAAEGESLRAVAGRYNVAVPAVLDANPSLEPRFGADVPLPAGTPVALAPVPMSPPPVEMEQVPATMVVGLRAPRTLDRVAAEHGVAVDQVVGLNRPRYGERLTAQTPLPRGALVTLPVR